MLIPPKLKYLKIFDKRVKNKNKNKYRNFFYSQANLISLCSGKISAAEWSIMNRVVKKTLGKTTKTWDCVKPNVPVTSKPTASRMGKGKGNVKYYVTLTAKSQPLLQFQSTKYRNQNQLKAVMLKKLNAIISLPVSIRNTKSRWN